MLAMFLTDEMVEKVTNLFKSELQDFLGESAKDLGRKLEESLDVKELVRVKVEAFSSNKLEEILVAIMSKEFRFIEIIGALLGFFIGCVPDLIGFKCHSLELANVLALDTNRKCFDNWLFLFVNGYFNSSFFFFLVSSPS